MTSEMYDTLEDCISQGIDEACGYMTQDDMEVEFGMEYDGKVEASSLEFNSAHELGEKIMRGVEKAYKMTEIEE